MVGLVTCQKKNGRFSALNANGICYIAELGW